MPRTPKPWRRGGPDAPWYATVKGKQAKVAGPEASFAEAVRAMHEARKAAESSVARPTDDLTVGQAVELFLDFVDRAVRQGDRSPRTLRGYEAMLLPLADAFERTPVADLREEDVARWIATKGWGPTTRLNAITAAKACFNRLVKLRRLASNPIAHMERPVPRRREYVPDDATYARMLEGASDDAFRELLEMLSRTGCRPGELYPVEAKDVDLDAGTMRVRNKTYRKTGDRTRVVPLASATVEQLRRLVAARPDGPLLRNRDGRPWEEGAVGRRFRRLRRRLGIPEGACAYALRHKYVTDALEAGVPIATVAEVVGHKDMTMIMRVYSKLSQRVEHLREATERVSSWRQNAGPGTPQAGPR